jgi:DNA uptake protein ComE-like DNA-binding protein
MKRTSLIAALAAAVALTAPLVAQATATTPAKTTAKQTSMSTAKHGRTHRAKVDLNTASKEDLMKLKGMTDADADKIIAARPFTSVSELKSKNIIDAAEYGKIHGWVVVKKASAAKK